VLLLQYLNAVPSAVTIAEIQMLAILLFRTTVHYFFRVSGRNAAEFGKAQGENVPRLSSVNSRTEKATGQSKRHSVEIIPGSTSARLWTRDDIHGMKTLLSTSFTMNGREVRPQNYAVRVWKRVA